jgi:hypothetical protein
MASQSEIAGNLHMLAGLIRDAVILGPIDDALLDVVKDISRGNSENSKANRIETIERSRGIWTNLFGGSKKNSEENSEK